jgi:predicted deacylase
MVAKGMIDGDIGATHEGTPTVTDPVNCDTSGIFKAAVEMGEVVGEGTELAQIVNSKGETLEKIVSSAEGTVWAMRRFASIRAGEMAYLIGLTGK